MEAQTDYLSDLRAVARGDANLVDRRVFAMLVHDGLAVYSTTEKDAELTEAGRKVLEASRG